MPDGVKADPDQQARTGLLGMPDWFYVVVLDVIALLGLVIWIVTQNPENLPAYEAATTWAAEILALSYLAAVLFGLTRVAIRGGEVRLAPWGVLTIVALGILGVHWAAPVAVAGVVLGQAFAPTREG